MDSERSYWYRSGMNRWWEGHSEEIYWLEITDRRNLGVDLNAPQRKDDGNEFWGYSLIREIEEGDIIFHYDKRRHAVVASSRAAGGVWEDDVVWGAHGATARGAGVEPYKRPGWRLGLEQFQDLSPELLLDEIRGRQRDVVAIRAELAEAHGRTLYFPFEVSERRPLRPVQGYLAKFPAALVALFPILGTLAANMTLPAERTSGRQPDLVGAAAGGLGAGYRRADEDSATSPRDPFSVDPALVERGTRGHARTQNALASFLMDRGIQPRSPAPGEPNYDLAWEVNDRIFVAEVKSLTRANEEKQLRLGLGQALRYRQLMTVYRGETSAVLAVERQPTDQSWSALASQVGVFLVWPGTFEAALGDVAPSSP